jgi:hypothetical protein
MDQRTRYLNARQVLKGAIKYFYTHSLQKTGHYYSESGACAIGSCMQARYTIPELSTNFDAENDAIALLYKQFNKEHPGDTLTLWSDGQATKADVVSLLKRTLRNAKSLWEERVVA